MSLPYTRYVNTYPPILGGHGFPQRSRAAADYVATPGRTGVLEVVLNPWHPGVWVVVDWTPVRSPKGGRG